MWAMDLVLYELVLFLMRELHSRFPNTKSPDVSFMFRSYTTIHYSVYIHLFYIWHRIKEIISVRQLRPVQEQDIVVISLDVGICNHMAALHRHVLRRNIVLVALSKNKNNQRITTLTSIYPWQYKTVGILGSNLSWFNNCTLSFRLNTE